VSDQPASAPAPKKNRWLGPVLKYGLAVGLLTLMISLNYSKLKELFSQPPQLVPFAIAAGIYLVILGMQYVRWWVLVRALDLPFTFRNAFRLGLVGTFYNTFLPGAIGGDFVKMYFIVQDHPERKAAAAATVIADRLLGLFGLLMFGGFVGGGFWLAGNDKIEANAKLQYIIAGCAVVAAVGLIGFLALGFVPARRRERFAERLKKLPKGQVLSELWFTAVQYRSRPGAILLGILLSAIAHTAMIVSFHYSVQIFPPADSGLLGTLPEHFVIAPIGFIAQAVIPVPGGLGAGEFTFGGLYGLIRPGLEKAPAVALTGRLSLRLVEWTLGLIGYIVFLSMKKELPIVEDENPDPEMDRAIA
jgi:uncharacterized membrane protein YbhN (UPF0104 family)